MKRGWLAGAIFVGLLSACSSDGTSSGGAGDAGNGGSSSSSGGGSSSGAASSSGGTSSGGASSGATPPKFYCGQADATECVCSLTAGKGLTEGASCGPSNVGSPSLCCAVPGWPASQPQSLLNAGCFCSKIFCATSVFGDTCQCGFAAPSQGDKPTSSCTGQICCRSKSDVAPTCSCFKTLSQCPFKDDEPVPSCSPSEVKCADQTVPLCH